jgi:hypothetical protein
MRTFLLSCLAAAAALTAHAIATPAAADIDIDVYLGAPLGPSYYYGGVRRRLISCEQGRRAVDRRGFNRVVPIDCRPRYYAYNAWRSGRLYRVTIDARTARTVDVRRR